MRRLQSWRKKMRATGGRVALKGGFIGEEIRNEATLQNLSVP